MRKQAGLLFLIKIFRIPLNLILLSLTAKYFGVRVEKDVWLLAFATMTVVDSALWGPINETFRTKFVFIKEQKSDEEAISQTQSLLTYFFIFSLVLMGAVMLFPGFFAQIIAPKYNARNLQVLSDMLYLVAPVLVFNQLMQIGISILNAYEVFFIAEMSGFVSTIINIILLYFLANSIGIVSLPIAYYISTGLLIVFIVVFILRHKIPLFKRNWNFKFNGFKMFFLFAVPFFLPYFFGQINGLVEKILAGGISSGTISILDFASRVPQLMYGIVINIITTILVPVLSRFYIRGEGENYNEEFRKIFQLGLLFMGIIASFVAGSSVPVIHLLYDKGTIPPSDLTKIADMSVLYSFSLIGIFFYIIFGMSLLSSENQKYYALMGMLTQIVVVVLNFALVKWLGMYIFPISILVSHTLFGYLMARKYPYRNGLHLHIKYFLLVAVLSAVAYFGISRIQAENFYISLVLQGGVLGLVLLVLSFVFGLEEKQLALNFVKSKLNRRK